MALSKKGTRKIQINGDDYRWGIRHKPTYSSGLEWTNLTAVVELYNDPQSKLIIDFLCPRNDSFFSNYSNNVTPRFIANAIAEGLDSGWKPFANSNHQINYKLD